MRKILPGILLIVLSVYIAQRLFPKIQMKQLTVITIPSGAIVTINGVPAGISPLTRFVPGEGVYVLAEKEGFSESDSLMSSALDTLFLQLREDCLVIVNTDPTGCQIISHGFTGISPCSIAIESGNSIEITALGEMGISVSRSLNVLTPGTRLVNIVVPYEFSCEGPRSEFVVIPQDLLPFAMGPMTVGQSEVTVSQFAEFMNSVDPGLLSDSTSLRGRTCLMDSILKCNWRGPVAFNADSTAYAPLDGMENHPMVGMTLQGARWYCDWLSESSSLSLEFRLPDCDEWDILASAGAYLAVNLSDANEILLGRHPEFDDGWAQTAPAGALGKSEWGLCEMQGNVWELTSLEGIAVGGSWLSSREDCRAGSRIELSDQMGYPFVGFRVVATGHPRDITEGLQ